MRGKVRDIYDLGDKLLIVATDRISAFDVVMANGIPYKGIILTQISKFWFDFLSDDVEHHLISDKVSDFPAPFCKFERQLAGRSMLVKRVKVLPIECVVRGYLAGSGWKEYKESGRFADRSCRLACVSAKNCRNLFLHRRPRQRGERMMRISASRSAWKFLAPNGLNSCTITA